LRIANLIPREFGEVAKRWATLKAGAYAVREHPLAGFGPGCFKHAFGRYMARAMPVGEHRQFTHTYSESYAHNDFAQWLTENGVPGFGLLAWLVVTAVAALRRAPPASRGLAGPLVACGLALGIHGAANLPLHIAPTAFLFWLGIGLASALAGPVIASAPAAPGWRAPVAGGAAVLTGMLAGAMFLTSLYARLGKDYLNFSAWEASRRAWGMARRVDWDDRREAFFAASMTFQLGRKEESIPVFQQEVARNPYYMDGFANLGSALGAISADLTARGDRKGAATYLGEAEMQLKRAIELNPAYAEAWANLGVAYLQVHKRVEAADAFRAALDLEPGLALAESGLAQARGGGR
jgi:tetratricopeptide (TPR) repeat protein